MTKYKFDWLNGGAEITDPLISWFSAGFNTKGNGKMTLDIELKTDSANFIIQLSKEGQATDRSNEAIEQLMYALLEPYKVQ